MLTTYETEKLGGTSLERGNDDVQQRGLGFIHRARRRRPALRRGKIRTLAPHAEGSRARPGTKGLQSGEGRLPGRDDAGYPNGPKQPSWKKVRQAGRYRPADAPDLYPPRIQ